MLFHEVPVAVLAKKSGKEKTPKPVFSLEDSKILSLAHETRVGHITDLEVVQG